MTRGLIGWGDHQATRTYRFGGSIYRTTSAYLWRRKQYVWYPSRQPRRGTSWPQEVFVKAYFGLPGFEGRSTFKHWLQRIKVHHCLNHLKRREGKDALAIDDQVGESFGDTYLASSAFLQ